MFLAFRRWCQLAGSLALVASLVGFSLAPASAGSGASAKSARSAGETAEETLAGPAAFAAQRDALSAAGLDAQLCGAPQPLQGSLADIVQSSAFESLVCSAQRTAYALQQTQKMVRQSADGGADCRTLDLQGRDLKSNPLELSANMGEIASPYMYVCFSDVSIWAQRGGTTYGRVFLTSSSYEEFKSRAHHAAILTHEYRHYYQWRLLGQYFPSAYLLAGADACANVFEQAAGLVDGGYRCR